jgi:hypothetical protein
VSEIFNFDWVDLPSGMKTVSLWHSLHDGEVCAIYSNLLERTLRIEFDVLYLREFHELPDNMKFILEFHGTRSVGVMKYAVWPGEFSVPEGVSRDEESRLITEYRSKWREESESWSAFESSVAQGDQFAEVSDATLAVGDGAGVALTLGILKTDGSYREAFVRAESLLLLRSDGQQLDLEEFVKLGQAYWDAFATRSS